MSTISVSEARATLPAILDRVLAGEEVTITRHGEAVAVVLRPDALRVRRTEHIQSGAQRIHDALANGRRTRRLEPVPVLTADRAEAHIAEIYASRAER